MSYPKSEALSFPANTEIHLKTSALIGLAWQMVLKVGNQVIKVGPNSQTAFNSSPDGKVSVQVEYSVMPSPEYKEAYLKAEGGGLRPNMFSLLFASPQDNFHLSKAPFHAVFTWEA